MSNNARADRALAKLFLAAVVAASVVALAGGGPFGLLGVALAAAATAAFNRGYSGGPAR